MPEDPMVTALCQWAAQNEPAPVRAAIDLLIKEGWLRRPDFARYCVTVYGTGADTVTTMDWPKARAFLAGAPIGSTTELAILDFAIVLAQDRFRLGNMGRVHRQWIVDAVAYAVGLDVDFGRGRPR